MFLVHQTVHNMSKVMWLAKLNHSCGAVGSYTNIEFWPELWNKFFYCGESNCESSGQKKKKK